MTRSSKTQTNGNGNHSALWMDEPAEFPVAAAAGEPEDVVPEGPAAETSSSHGADDSLGLYLRQMGAIPLLNRQQELALARRLERGRSRFRKSVLWSWYVLEQVAATFE